MKTNLPTGDPPAEASGPGRWAMASLMISMLMSSLDTSIAHAGLPTLQQAFAASFQQVQWILLAYLLAITTLIVSAGKLGDIIGHRRLFVIGVALFTAASALCGIAPTLWFLIVARTLQGVGAAVMMALAAALIGRTTPKARIGGAMGLLGTMSALGTTLGPSLGGVLIDAFGWRSIFLINIPIGMTNLVLAGRYLQVDRASGRSDCAKLDPLGMLVLAATLAAYALAMTLGRNGFGGLDVLLFVLAAVGAVSFFLVETRAASPLIRLSLFRIPVLSASLIMNTLVSTVMISTLVVGPFYLSLALGLRMSVVGLALSIGPLVAAMSGLPAGRLVDRLGSRRATLIGLVGMAAAATALSMIPPHFGVAGYVAPLGVLTAHYALFQAANYTAAMSVVPPDDRGVVSGMLSLSRNMGLITGTALMGAVFAAWSGVSEISEASPGAIATGMRTTLAVAVLMIVVAIIAAVASAHLARRRFLPSSAGPPADVLA